MIRMGIAHDELMNTSNPRIIEYAHRGFRSDLLDIYLASHCSFFISGGTGFDSIPWFFKKPEVYVNISDFNYLISWSPHCVIIFKRHWLRKEKKISKHRRNVENEFCSKWA